MGTKRRGSTAGVPRGREAAGRELELDGHEDDEEDEEDEEDEADEEVNEDDEEDEDDEEADECFSFHAVCVRARQFG